MHDKTRNEQPYDSQKTSFQAALQSQNDYDLSCTGQKRISLAFGELFLALEEFLRWGSDDQISKKRGPEVYANRQVWTSNS